MKLTVSFTANGQTFTQDQDFPFHIVKTTITRRIKTAWPEATNIQITEKPEAKK